MMLKASHYTLKNRNGNKWRTTRLWDSQGLAQMPGHFLNYSEWKDAGVYLNRKYSLLFLTLKQQSLPVELNMCNVGCCVM